MVKQQYHHGDLKNALVQSGMRILATEGLAALSLRRVASQAGVSHSAPYAHFADKQALIAAISTAGFQRLYDRLSSAAENARHPATRLADVSYAYLQFALAEPALFKLMFSGLLESGAEYPEFVSQSKQSFAFLVDLVKECQAAGVLRSTPEEPMAVSLWSLVHGLTALLLERQISHRTLEQYSPRALLCQALSQVTLAQVGIEPEEQVSQP